MRMDQGRHVHKPHACSRPIFSITHILVGAHSLTWLSRSTQTHVHKKEARRQSSLIAAACSSRLIIRLKEKMRLVLRSGSTGLLIGCFSSVLIVAGRDFTVLAPLQDRCLASLFSIGLCQEFRSLSADMAEMMQMIHRQCREQSLLTIAIFCREA